MAFAARVRKYQADELEDVDTTKLVSNSERFTIQEVIQALHDSNGFLSSTATALRCAPSTVQEYIDRYNVVANEAYWIRERLLDFAENALLEKMQEGDVSSIQFFLKTQGGSSRGYLERRQVESVGDGVLSINLVEVPHRSQRELEELGMTEGSDG